MELPPEMAQMRALLDTLARGRRVATGPGPAVLGGSYARSAYRAQLLPCWATSRRQHLKGATATWRASLAGALVGRAGRSE